MHPRLSATLRTIFTVALTVLGAVFFFKSRTDIQHGLLALRDAHDIFVILAFLCAITIILSQAKTVQLSYSSIDKKIPFSKCLSLFLKRFFLSPFIPGGYSVAQYTLTKDLEEYDISPSQHAYASTAYVVAGYISYIVLLVPLIVYFATLGSIQASFIYSVLIITSASLVAFGLILYVFRAELLERLRQWLRPHLGHINRKSLAKIMVWSFVAETTGVLMLWASLAAVGARTSFATAALGFIVTILIVTISPFFQGILVVEGGLVYTLSLLHVDNGQALAAAVVFRTFQLWIVLIIGGALYVIPFIQNWRQLHRRIFKKV